MDRRAKVAIGAGVVAAVVAVGTGIGLASGGDDSEAPITGTALERASAAALEHTGSGRVTETEVGDEDSYYEVVVTLDSGKQVDVQLDEYFTVVKGMPDRESDSGDDA